MLVSIVIPSYNNLMYLKTCIEHILKFTPKGKYEIIIVDNNSDEDTIQYLKTIEESHFIKVLYNNENQGYVKACNLGIENSKGDVIVLLNNDIFVTPNWLDNLLKCLYHDELIGAVSPVTNNSPYYQSINIQFTDLDEMISFSEYYNCSNPLQWEERLKLVGYCILIKREVIEKVGLLDESFTPGNYEDDDYSIRILNAGYKLFLCNDTFVYHVGGVSFRKLKDYNILLSRNRQKFIDKWGIIPDRDLKIDVNLRKLINFTTKNEIKILEIGCGCGANLLYLKNKMPNVLVYGLEKNSIALNIARKVANVWELDDEMLIFKKMDEKFDYVICLDLIDKFSDYKRIIKSLHNVMKEDSVLIIAIENEITKVLHNIIKLLKSINTKNDALYLINKITINQLERIRILEKILENSLYQVEIYNVQRENDDALEELCNAVKKEFGKEAAEVFKIHEFILMAKSKNSNDFSFQKNLRKLKFLLRRLEFDIDLNETLQELKKLFLEESFSFSIGQIVDIVDCSIINKSKVLNNLAVLFLENNVINEALKLLEESYFLNPQHKDTVYNLAYLLHTIGESRIAYEILSNLIEKDDQIVNLMEEIALSLGRKGN